MPPTTFAEVSAIAPRSPGHFTAELSPEWTIAGKPNGGYLLGILSRAAATVGPHPHVIAASAHYLHSPDPGRVSVEAEVLRAGRSISQVRARMIQDGRACVEALMTTSQLDRETVAYWDKGLPTREIAPPQDCVRIPPETPTRMASAIMAQVDLRVDPATLGFASGQPSGRGELWGWLTLPADEPFTPASLLYAVDAFPPSTFEVELTGWVPTLELTVYIRALPAPGPVRVLQRASLIDAQRVDENCFVWDCTGRLVAQSTQLAGVRLG
jgi:Thioesterase-like superfamily